MMMVAVVLTSLLSAPAFAGIIIGNGGIGLECGATLPVRLYDLWEAEEIVYKMPNRAKLTLNDPPGETEHEKFFSLMVRVRMRFPELADAITREYAAFETKTVPVNDWNLGDPPNSLIGVVPDGCVPRTIILQQPRPAFRRSPRFLRSQELFARMPVLHRMYAGVHESVFAIGLEHGVEHALGVRQVMALLAANEYDLVTDTEWIEAFRQARIPYYEAAGYRIPLFSGELKPCELPVGSVNCVPQVPSWRQTEFAFDESERIAEVDFGDMGGEISIMGRDSVSVKVAARRFKFEHESDGNLRIAFRGTIEFATALASSVEKKVAFEGTINPRSGRIEGAQLGTESGRKLLVGSISSVYARVEATAPLTAQTER